MLENFDKLTEEINEAQKSFQEKALIILREAIKEMFERFSFLKEIKWSQSHFNDGDPCVFSLYCIEYKVDQEYIKKEIEEEEEPYYDLYYLKLNEDDHAVFKKFQRNLYQIEDFLQTAFGEATIIATKDELKISDAPEHD